MSHNTTFALSCSYLHQCYKCTATTMPLILPSTFVANTFPNLLNTAVFLDDGDMLR